MKKKWWEVLMLKMSFNIVHHMAHFFGADRCGTCFDKCIDLMDHMEEHLDPEEALDN